MKKISLRFSLLSFAAIATTALIVTAVHGFQVAGNVATPDPGYSIVLDDTNAPFSLDSNYARESDPETVFESGDYTLNIKYRLAKYEDSGHVTLAPHGLLYNDIDNSTHKNRITSLASIKVTYSSSASLSVRTSIRNDGKEFSAPRAVASNTLVEFDDNPYYFILEAGDAEALIESVVLNYSCAANSGYILSDLSGTYTGVGSDSSTYKLTLNGSTANISSLDKASNVSFDGTAEIVDGNKIQCTLPAVSGTYTSTISEDHSTLTFASKAGGASAFPEITFKKVYQVENFEGFSATGNGFGGSGRKESSLYSMSGLRAAFHSDWYTTSTDYTISYFGDNGWRLMGSTDFLTYFGTKGHNSSKAAAFKGNGNGLRYIQMKGAYGLPNIIGKGAYMSFWAKAFSNADCSSVRTSDLTFKAYGFFEPTITKSNVTLIRTSNDVTIPGNSDWARYVVPLDASKEYYSYGFYLNPSATAYVLIDDIEIYTADPYAEYVAPVAVTDVTVSPSVLALDVGQHSTLTATVEPSNATNKTVAWTTSDDAVATVSSDGTVTAVGAGTATITATTADGGFTDTCAVTVTAPLYAPYPEGTFMAVVGSYKLVIAIGNETNGLVAVRISTADVTPTGITYDKNDGTFSITTTGSVGGYTVGTISGVYDYANDQLLHVNCSGQIGSAVSDVTLTRPANLLTCDANTATLQATFGRRYRSKGASSWSNDTSNTDRIQSETTNVLSGAGSMSVRPCGNSFDAYGFVLKSDLASPQTVGSLHFWVYNPCDYDITFRGYYYKGTSFGSNGQIGFAEADKAKAHSWTYVSRGFTSSAIYNFTITVWTADQTQAATSMSARLVFDDILLY